MDHDFNHNFAVRNMGTPAQWADATLYAVSTWISMAGYDRAIFLPHCGELDGDMVVSVYEATDSAGTGAQAVSGLTGTFTNGEDEGLPGIIELRAAQLTDGYQYINLQVNPGAADGFSGILLLTDAKSAPVTNTLNSHVAFKTGEQ